MAPFANAAASTIGLPLTTPLVRLALDPLTWERRMGGEAEGDRDARGSPGPCHWCLQPARLL